MMIKKFLSTVMAVAMLASVSMSVAAEGVASEAEIQPRYYVCYDCGVGALYSHLEYGNWWHDGSTIFDCIHGFPYGSDEIKTRNVYEVWECNTCSYSDQAIIDTETRKICYGRDQWSIEVE